MNIENKTDDRHTYLAFGIGSDVFAVEVIKVLEVLRDPLITPVPNSEDFIVGILNFRGDIVSIVNTVNKLYTSDVPQTEHKVVIIFELPINGKTEIVGATADSVDSVFKALPKDIQAVPDFGSTFKVELLSGIVRRNNVYVRLLDIDKMFVE